MIAIIIMILSLLLDGLLTNFLPYLVNDLTYFTPLLTLVTIFLIYPFYRKKEKKYYITVFIMGIIYDLFYTNLLFLNATLFLLIALLTRLIYKNYEVAPLRLILYIIILITVYEGVQGLILWIFQVVPVTITKVFYKITHSLLLNILYSEIIYLIIRIIPEKYKKISIN